jgi:hypothetical protein
MGFGGPVWHASISARAAGSPVNLTRKLFDLALDELAGVGDATLGEWRELGNVAVHLRRRLTPVEAAIGQIAAVVDVRGTPEFTTRIDAMRAWLPPAMRNMPLEMYP